MLNGKSTSSYQDTKIENDGFWPNLNAGDFEKRRGIPLKLDSEAVALSLAAAVSQINIELAEAKAGYEAEGITKAEDIPGLPKVLGKNSIIVLYEKAVFARAKSDMVSEFASVSTKDAGDRIAENERDITDRLLAESQQHLRALSGSSRCGVDLL
ncbi:TPA: head completion/stabilization protein [Vibrio parahaemolyticus]|uniref:head completion/stabilization protein n=1 Tax=Vibrio parahaemolyticus TaxID=670 RepID=UPI000A3B4F96|nr:head completion/stabilization protein [Vibrio parahaemolyticus]EIV8657121.1 head completion/stabilization protein [Vibrio parahaemolyticus]MBE3850045.1 head completion/stabilization protein [Vibrio parahaemolyticus]MBE3925888.1 head completion/stabilization protein [Vibrio parahaemolyticus]MBE4105671.1 head completion/stabilization protein [Vibrio parahaemolyticus]MBE4371089.1 head completion/stabilization protein [Vibrio parahaemolyticus]